MAAKKPDLKIALFCGGAGTRMWPASRENKPKQFQPLVGNKSTFEMMVDRLKKGFSPQDIHPVTNRQYVGEIVKQAPEIPLENIIIEPERRDTLAAVGFATAILSHKFGSPNILSLWSDHLIRNNNQFISAINSANQLVYETQKPVEIAVRPTFASTQLGYLKVDKMIKKINGMDVFEFVKQIEKPDIGLAKDFYNSREYLWHIGYSIWPSKYMLSLIEKYQPDVSKALKNIIQFYGKDNFEKVLNKEYSTIPKTSIDYGILEKIQPRQQLVLSADLGWSDIGAWDVLKDELSDSPKQNVITGQTIVLDSNDSLIYSLVDEKVVAVAGVDGLIIVDTADALLVCTKNQSQQVKKIIERLKESKKNNLL